MITKLLMGAALALTLNPLCARAELGTLWDCKGVRVEQAGPAAAKPGQVITYQLRLINEGSCDFTEASFTDYLPRQSAFHSATPAPASSPLRSGDAEPDIDPRPMRVPPVHRVEWKPVRLPRDSALLFQLQVRVAGPAARTITNFACFEHPQAGRVCGTFDTVVVANQAEALREEAVDFRSP